MSLAEESVCGVRVVCRFRPKSVTLEEKLADAAREADALRGPCQPPRINPSRPTTPALESEPREHSQQPTASSAAAATAPKRHGYKIPSPSGAARSASPTKSRSSSRRGSGNLAELKDRGKGLARVPESSRDPHGWGIKDGLLTLIVSACVKLLLTSVCLLLSHRGGNRGGRTAKIATDSAELCLGSTTDQAVTRCRAL